MSVYTGVVNKSTANNTGSNTGINLRRMREGHIYE